MQRIRRLAHAAAGSFAMCTSAGSLHAQDHCRPVGSDSNYAQVHYMRDIVAGADSEWVAKRARLGMPRSDSNRIRNVVNEFVCAQAVRVMDSLWQQVRSERVVDLYRLPNGWYGAVDPSIKHQTLVFLFDPKVNYKEAFSLGN